MKPVLNLFAIGCLIIADSQSAMTSEARPTIMFVKQFLSFKIASFIRE
jgi:hypothetical protein